MKGIQGLGQHIISVLRQHEISVGLDDGRLVLDGDPDVLTDDVVVAVEAEAELVVEAFRVESNELVAALDADSSTGG